MNKTILENDCVLCKGLSTNFLNYTQTYPSLINSPILFETDNYVAIPDKYPLNEGHILVVPRKHKNSFAEFNSEDSSEIGFICDKLQKITRANYFLTFEHGTSKLEQVITDPKIKSIFHAHLQFIPNLEFTYKNLEDFFGEKSVLLLDNSKTQRFLEEYKQNYVGNDEIVNFLKENIVYDDISINSVASYLYVKTSDNYQFLFPEYLITPKLPSQFLREALSNISETNEWDWKIPMTNKGIKRYFDRITKTIALFKK